MAALAMDDQKKRSVEVNRVKLLATLKENLTTHVAEYEEAMAGYKSELISRTKVAFEKAKVKLAEKETATLAKFAKLTQEDIVKQRDYVTLLESETIEMKVPRSFAEEYKAAIDMFTWDVREVIELTYAEFTCFVRDQWDWKAGFTAVSAMYKG
jgi:hypothetical protein